MDADAVDRRIVARSSSRASRSRAARPRRHGAAAQL